MATMDALFLVVVCRRDLLDIFLEHFSLVDGVRLSLQCTVHKVNIDRSTDGLIKF